MRYISREICCQIVCAAALARVVVAAQVTHPAIGTLTYPDSWYTEVYDPEKGPVELMSFEAYLHGGVLPPGGAVINIQVLPPEQSNESAVAKLDHEGRGRRSKQRLQSQSAERLDLTDGLLRERKIALARRVDGRQFLFTLTCSIDDPQFPQWEKILLAVVNSVSTGGK